jgi:radical SAM superfamily enzyme YgiQ (UPF0313 family)
MLVKMNKNNGRKENKIKITLVSPYEISINVASGIRCLSSYLKAHGHQVDLIFMSQKGRFKRYDGQFTNEPYSGKAVQNLIDLCRDSDLVGFSFMTNFFLKVRDLTGKIKQQLDTPVIWGGIHATVRPEESIRYADMLCIGEGEDALLELAEKWKSGDIHRIRNLWIKKGDEVIKNPVRPLEENLDRFPFQDYDISTHYVLDGDDIIPMDDEVLERVMPRDYEFTPPRIRYYMITARNCPMNCTYCCNNALRKIYRGKGRFVRKRSIPNVIQELETILERFPFFNEVSIFDDTFFFRSPEEMREFSRIYKEKINLPITCSASPQTLQEDKLRYLTDAGLYNMSIGFQSVSQDTLNNIFKRPTSRKLIDRTITLMEQFKDKIPRPVYHFIIDNPYESNASIKTTIEFMMTLPARSRIYMFPLTFFPGTELYNQALKDGLIQDEIKDIYLRFWTIDHVHNLNYLTILLYFVVWSKFHPKVMKAANALTRFFMQNWIVSIMDKKIMIKMLYGMLKSYMAAIRKLGKIRRRKLLPQSE